MAHRGRRGLQLVLPPRAEHDAGALASEGVRRGTADAAARAGDDHDLAMEPLGHEALLEGSRESTGKVRREATSLGRARADLERVLDHDLRAAAVLHDLAVHHDGAGLLPAWNAGFTANVGTTPYLHQRFELIARVTHRMDFTLREPIP